MPAGHDNIRTKYFHAERTHPNRARKRKTGFEGNNWPSTRTYYSDVPIHVVELAKRFQFYTCLLFKGNQGGRQYFLETISRHLGNYVSNYTIDGLLNEKWGIRHKPKQTTIVAIEKLIEWEKDTLRELKLLEPFKFRYDESHLVQTKKTKHESKPKEKDNSNQDRQEGEEETQCRVNQYRDEDLCRRARQRQLCKVVGLYSGPRNKV